MMSNFFCILHSTQSCAKYKAGTEDISLTEQNMLLRYPLGKRCLYEEKGGGIKRDDKERQVKRSPSHHTSKDKIKQSQSWKGKENIYREPTQWDSGHCFHWKYLVLITAEATKAQGYA